MKIIVLAGGVSPERDVSLVSGSRIAKALIQKGHQVFLLDLYYGLDSIERDLIFTSSPEDIKEYAVTENIPDVSDRKLTHSSIGKNVIECCKRCDVVFLALHGDIGENGKMQAVLDINAIKYTGSKYDGCMLSMDKNISKILVSANHILTARWCINAMDSSLEFPCVIKPLNSGSSIGVSIVSNEDEYKCAVRLARKYDATVLIEEKIEGREFSVGILNNTPLPVIEIAPVNGFYDYKNKYQPHQTRETCPAQIPYDLYSCLQKTALTIHRLLHLGFYSRIDFIADDKNDIYFLEANSLPGMTPVSLLPQEALAAGISYEELCNQIALNAV